MEIFSSHLKMNKHDNSRYDYKCTVCGNSSNNSYVLKCKANREDPPVHKLYKCSQCTSLFFYPYPVCDYIEAYEKWEIKCYAETGAGISSILYPIIKVRNCFNDSVNFLDVGCGFGFSVDFTHHYMGWSSIGIEPSEFGMQGREDLGINIQNVYSFQSSVGPSSQDIVFSSEVIEHVTNPLEFVSHIKSFLNPRGILILTTPDASLIGELSESDTLSLLHPDKHIFLLTQKALLEILRTTGFKNIVIERSGYSLVAYASNEEFSLDSALVPTSDMYLNYLRARSRDFGLPFYIWIGFAQRLLRDLVNLSQMEEADQLFAVIKFRNSNILSQETIDGMLTYSDFMECINDYHSCVPIILYYGAMIKLNHRADYKAASWMFERSYLLAAKMKAMKFFSAPEISSLVDLACYHTALAYVFNKDLLAAQVYLNKLPDLRDDDYLLMQLKLLEVELQTCAENYCAVE